MEHVRPPVMAPTLRPPGFARLLALLVRREAGSKLASFFFFLVASIVCLIAFAYGSGFQHTFETESVLVTTDPLMALNAMVVVFLGLVLGLRLATSLSWEREHRTLEVLLVGPVSWSAVVLSKFLVELSVLAVLIAIYALYLLAGQPLGWGVIGIRDTLSTLESSLFVLPVMAFGILVAAWARSVRSAVVLYLVLIGLLAAFEGVLGVLSAMPAEDMGLASLYLRAGFEAIAPVLRPFSPVACLASMVERLFTQDPANPAQIAAAVALTLGMLAVSPLLARARGVQG
jgi:ABC-type transport system involved in multi-copper enzyme maturation permease subunit